MNLVILGGPVGRPPSFYFGVLLRLMVAVGISLALAGIASGQTTNLLLETFESVTEPDLPATVTTDNTSWKTSTSSVSPPTLASPPCH